PLKSIAQSSALRRAEVRHDRFRIGERMCGVEGPEPDLLRQILYKSACIIPFPGIEKRTNPSHRQREDQLFLKTRVDAMQAIRVAIDGSCRLESGRHIDFTQLQFSAIDDVANAPGRL